MTPLFKKLNYKAQDKVLVVGYPDSFRDELQAMEGATHVVTDIQGVEETEFALFFVTDQKGIDSLVPIAAKLLKGDGVLWFAYPKQSSKRFHCTINRDKGWDILGEYGFEPVRQVAIDEDWSAVRFRRVEFIAKMVRKGGAMTEKGKERVEENLKKEKK